MLAHIRKRIWEVHRFHIKECKSSTLDHLLIKSVCCISLMHFLSAFEIIFKKKRGFTLPNLSPYFNPMPTFITVACTMNFITHICGLVCSLTTHLTIFTIHTYFIIKSQLFHFNLHHEHNQQYQQDDSHFR